MRLVLFLLLALVAAGGTAMAVRGYVNAERAALAARGETAEAEVPAPEVLVAAEDIPAGTLLKEEHFVWRAWPAEGVGESFVVRGKGTEPDELSGSVARQALAAGEPVTPARVVRPGDRGFLAAILSPGMRAVTVPVDAASGVAGLVFPGDRVDVVLTHTVDARGNGDRPLRASETVLKDIRVLAIDQRTDRGEGQPAKATTATLEVTPQQVEITAMVQELGRLSLSLRALLPGDAAADGERPSFTVDSAVSPLLARPKNGPAAPKPAATVDVVRGAAAERVAFGQPAATGR